MKLNDTILSNTEVPLPINHHHAILLNWHHKFRTNRLRIGFELLKACKKQIKIICTACDLRSLTGIRCSRDASTFMADILSLHNRAIEEILLLSVISLGPSPVRRLAEVYHSGVELKTQQYGNTRGNHRYFKYQKTT